MIKTQVTATTLLLLCAAALVGCSQQSQQATTSDANTAMPAQTAPKEETVSTAKEGTATGVHEGTISGAISDSMCGKDHMKMGDMGKDAELCSHKCV